MLALCYHAVSEQWPAALSVTPERLEVQLRYLVERGYRGATFTDAVQSGDRRTVAITFDDAYRSVFEIAAPILARLQLPATVFVPTRWLGKDSAMDWPGVDHWSDGPHAEEMLPMSVEQLRGLADDGWEIGSHTVTHPRLPELDDETLAWELVESRRICEQQLAIPCTSIAYPYGAHDERVISAAGEAGYQAAGTLPGPLHPQESLRWPRVGIYHEDSDWRFKVKVSPVISSLRGMSSVRKLEAAVRGGGSA